MTRKLLRLFLPALAIAAGTLACDNVGRAFDPDGSTPTTATGVSAIQRMVAGGTSVEGRPKVREVFPEDSGWPGTVPVIVVFNETINEASVAPGGSTPPNLYLRTPSTGSIDPPVADPNLPPTPPAPTPIAATYDFLLGGTVVVIRPALPFDPTQATEIELVATEDLRDADGVRFTSSEEQVIARFTPNQGPLVEDGEILTVLPVDNNRDIQRDATVYVVFDKPPAPDSITTGAGGSLVLRDGGGAIVDGVRDFPVGLGGDNADSRIVSFQPTALLEPNTTYELTVDETITFGDGKLEFHGRRPFARFTTMAMAPALGVMVGNPSAGAPDKVNRNNIASLRIDVDLPASTLAGDRVEVRVYGLKRDSKLQGDIAFVTRAIEAPVDGAQTLGIDFSGVLGTADAPVLAPGPLTIATRTLRGGRSTGYVLADASNEPALDLTAPSLTFPPLLPDGGIVHYTDHEHVAFYGLADERLSAATLVLDSTPAPAPSATSGTTFGFGSGGRFMFTPILLGRRTAPLGFSLTLVDAAGNESPPITGTVVQRGVVTGSLAGTLVVEAYDEASFAALAGATVLIEPGLPQKPAVGRQSAVTGSDGRATFTGLAGGRYTVTIVRDGYHLVSLLDSGAGFLSLPLRPAADATVTVSGTVVFAPAPGRRVFVGTNIPDDPARLGVLTTTAAPTAVPAFTVRPSRPMLVSAFAGPFEPDTVPAFAAAACSICGPTGLVPEAAMAPLVPGTAATIALALLPTTGTTRDLAATYNQDLDAWAGLDANALAGAPVVRVMASLFGFSGMTPTGIGFVARQGSTNTYSIQATYALAVATVMAPLGPKFWVTTQAVDTAGNLGRHRQIIAPLLAGTTVASGAVPAIPTITAPGGPVTGTPAITYQDRLDPAAIPTGLGFQVLTATDGAGRAWRLVQQDTDGATGARTVQLPDLTGVVPAGPMPGAWSLRAESHLVFNTSFGADDYLLEEMRREEVMYGRSSPVAFTVGSVN